MKHHPMTNEQREVLDNHLATIMESLSDTSNLLYVCYGDKDPRVARTEEAQAAVQRLLWAIERETEPTAEVSNAAGSARVREMVEVDVKGDRADRSVPG